MAHHEARLAKQVALFRRMGMFGVDDRTIVVRRAVTLEDLSAAYALVHDVFVDKGYIDPRPGRIRVRAFEALPRMATFVAERDGMLAGVMSIVPDSADLGLPSDQGFHQELDRLRDERRRICEITNLAVRPEYRRSNAFPELTRACFAQALAWDQDDIFIAISPGHAPFFEEILQFDPWGDERSYSADKDDIVQGKRMDLRQIAERWRETDRRLGGDAFLHDYYYDRNPYHGYIPPWAVVARRLFLSAESLRHLFVERSGLLESCTEEEREAIRRRWGDALFDAVCCGQFADFALA
jgi:hypothetical protein